MLKRFVVGLSCAAAFLSVSGCGVFKSSTSQASSESSSRSSSSCSPSGNSESAYQRDIRDYARAYADAGDDLDRFRRDVAAIAEDHGVTDWEADPATLVSIGRGLRGAGVQGERADQIAGNLAAGDQARVEWIRRGYEGRLQ